MYKMQNQTVVVGIVPRKNLWDVIQDVRMLKL